MAAKTKVKKKKRVKHVIEEVVDSPAQEEAKTEVSLAESVSTPTETPSEPPVAVETEAQVPDPASSSPEPAVEASAPTGDIDVEVTQVESAEERMKPTRKTNFKMIILITIVSALVAAFVSGGVYVYLNGINELSSTSEVTATPTPESVPTSSPTPTPDTNKAVDVSTFSVSVLNGSGAIGAAGKGQSILEDAGFSVEHTGNAANYNFKNTVVQFKSSVDASAVAKLKTALSDTYEVEVGETLTSSSKYDIVVTVGAN